MLARVSGCPDGWKLSEDEWDSSKDGRNVQTHYEKLWMYHCISIGVNPDYILTNIRPM